MSDLTLNLQEFLPFRLAITSHAVSTRIADEYQQRFGLKIPEWRLMAVLGEKVPMTQRGLVGVTDLDKVTVNRAAKSLEQRGLIERKAHDRDGRSHHLQLSSEGLKLYEEIVPIALSAQQRIESCLTGSERDMLVDLLKKLGEAAGAPQR